MLSANKVSNDCLYNAQSSETLFHKLLNDSIKFVQDAFSQLGFKLDKTLKRNRLSRFILGLLHEQEVIAVETQNELSLLLVRTPTVDVLKYLSSESVLDELAGVRSHLKSKVSLLLITGSIKVHL